MKTDKMENPENMPDWNLLAKFLAGEASHEEARQLHDWMSENSTNKAFVEKLKQTWHQSLELKDISKIDQETAKSMVRQRIRERAGEKEASKIQVQLDRNSFSLLFRIAAIAVVLLAIGCVTLYFVSNPKVNKLIVQTNNLKKENFKLPDGTIITLNGNTTLEYPEEFNESIREVYLTGEAFFDVVRNETKPFVIHTAESKITVLGTSFSVMAKNDIVEVVVESGKVELSGQDNGKLSVLLEKGDRGTLITEQKKLGKDLKKEKNTDPNYLAWKTEKLVFDEMPLGDVFSTLERVYGIELVIVEEKVRNCQLTASFDNQKISSILEIIRQTLDLDIKQDKKRYEIGGKGCFETVLEN